MFTDTHLADADRKAIHDFALEARALLLTEARDLLEGVYGLKADGTLAALDRLPNLAGDAEGEETWRRLGTFLADEVKAGLERREAVDKLVKEVAFTHLNRLVAFKMLEARRLIRQAVGKGRDSNGFKFFLADHADEEALWNSGEAGADAAYHHYLLWQAAQIAREVKVLFDPANLPSRLFPRPAALKALLELLNAEALTPAWTSPETIGWVYQYFNETEKADVFERLYKKKQKIRREDIPAATQLFTPRWIVRFLVENTLGRTWVQMHPETRLQDQLRYLVPLAGEIPPVPLKPVREITLLDPACGTMHFGLVAFDLFAEMYREELECAGQPGWPAAPSVGSEAEIPAAILAHNLFGIDIDLRAVQLAALTLYLKAKELNKDAVLTASNLACADVLALNGERLNAFLKEMNFQKPAYERLIRALWAKLKDINQLGSLLRLEDEIAGLVAEERARFEREGRQPDLFGERARFESEAAEAEYWEIVSAQLIQAFDEFARRAAERGADETYFAGEATKGLRVLDLMLRRYDCVTANPPYMIRRNLSPSIAELPDWSGYPDTSGDMYSAFIVRCSELVDRQGRLGMITQQSFMYNTSFAKLRGAILNNWTIDTIAHLGPGAFEEISGEIVNTVAFCFQQRSEGVDFGAGVYFRLYEAPRGKKQELWERQQQALIERADKHALTQLGVFITPQRVLHLLPQLRWIYWLSPSAQALLSSTDARLSSVLKVSIGLQTGDNPRFLRFSWEVDQATIQRAGHPRKGRHSKMGEWIPYTKGGLVSKWFGNQEYVVNWSRNGEAIREHRSSVVRNAGVYLKEGVTFSSLGSTFATRYLPPGFIFDQKSPSMHPSVGCIPVLAYLNSELLRTLLQYLTPSGVIGDKDLDHLPFRLPSPNWRGNESAHQLIRLHFAIAISDELFTSFVYPQVGRNHQLHQQSASYEAELDKLVYELYQVKPEELSSVELAIPIEDLEVEDARLPESGVAEDETILRADTNEIIRVVSYSIGMALGRFLPGIPGAPGSAIYRRDDFAIGSLPAPDEVEFNELVGSPDQFAYIDDNGGRHVFTAEVEAKLRALADKDGIVVLDEGHPDDLPAKVETALELMLGDRGAAEVIAEIGGDLRRFLERDFFAKWHVRWYRKRPIYWLLQSPRKLYGLYLFHERITKDTLFVVQRKYVDAKATLTRHLLAEKRKAGTAAGDARARRALNKEADALEKLLEDVEEFARRLKAITDRGYDPDINDGVILNMALLADVIPSWSKEPQKYWEGLEAGDYDWAHMAMKHWPERVKAKCKTDKSLAIAHGLA